MSDSPVNGISDSFRADGLRLHYHGWDAPGRVAVLAVVHGLAEHGGRYEATGRALAARGISTWALDQRGHGRSEGRRGHAHRFDCLLRDLDRFREVLRDRVEPGLPLFLLGHSMGGLVALRYLETYPDAFRAAVIISPWLRTAVPVPRWKAAVSGLLNRFAPALPFRAHVPAEFLSRDPAVVRAYIEDPLVHDTITPRLFAEVGGAMDAVFREAHRIRVPVLFLLAGSDRIVDTERGAAFARAVPGADVRVLEGVYHEVLNEPDAARQIEGVAAWIRDRAETAEYQEA